jgi:hypothetical protein
LLKPAAVNSAASTATRLTQCECLKLHSFSRANCVVRSNSAWKAELISMPITVATLDSLFREVAADIVESCTAEEIRQLIEELEIKLRLRKLN